MGDHRSDSRDSRDHLGDPGGGIVPVDKVIGRADWIVWPFGRWPVAWTDRRPSPRVPAAAGRRAMGRPRTRAGRTTAAGRRRRDAARAEHGGGDGPAPAAGGRTERRQAGPQRQAAARRRSAAREMPLLVVVALLIALVLKTFLVQAFVIPSGSMEQTIKIGDRVLVDKLTPWFGAKPQRGDVVVFKDPGGWLERARRRRPDRTRWSSSRSRRSSPSSACCPPTTSRT